MKIKKISNQNLQEHYFKIDNNFNIPILLYPMPQFNSTSAAFATNFGSSIGSFKQTNETNFTKIADGTAHYLEHKLFKDQGLEATFNLFSKNGAKANAQTSRNTTAYFFSCTQNFENSLKILLNFVQNPNFTEQSIQKERGIIGQEIQMLEDDPPNRTFDECMNALYVNHPAKNKIGGTIQTISEIDKTLLEKCYKTFYRLNNMAILVAGKFDLDSTLNLLEQNLKTPTQQDEPEIPKIDEPSTVAKKLVKFEMPVMLPYFCFGYKLEPPNEHEILKYKLIFELICELLVGEGSNLQSKIYEQNLVSGAQLSCSVEAGKGYFALIFSGQSTNYEKVLNLLNNEIELIKKNGFDTQMFNLVKKACFGEQISIFDSVENLNDLMLDCFDFYSTDLFCPIEVLSKLTLDDANHFMKFINPQNCVVSVCLPKK